MKSEHVVFNGIRFNRYPESKRKSDARYFRPHAQHIRSGVGYLHQEVWKAANGPIPEGKEIHHRDGNPSNNQIDNLELTTRREHMLHHPIKDTARMKRHLEKIRPLAAAWHKSEEGMALHRENGKKSAALLLSRPPRKAKCCVCGTSFQDKSLKGNAIYCSGACHQRQRRKLGLDKEMAQCSGCGVEFERRKYMGITRCRKCR